MYEIVFVIFTCFLLHRFCILVRDLELELRFDSYVSLRSLLFGSLSYHLQFNLQQGSNVFESIWQFVLDEKNAIFFLRSIQKIGIYSVVLFCEQKKLKTMEGSFCHLLGEPPFYVTETTNKTVTN